MDFFAIILLMITGFIILPVLLIISLIFFIFMNTNHDNNEKYIHILSRIIWVASMIPTAAFVIAVCLTDNGFKWLEPYSLVALWLLAIVIFLLGGWIRIKRYSGDLLLFWNKIILLLYTVVTLIWIGVMLTAALKSVFQA